MTTTVLQLHRIQANNNSGTEQDRVNCSFYLKIGACRHGDRCSRKHIKPQFSQTIMLPNVYNNPGHASEGARIGEERLQRNFDQFYEDWWIELSKSRNLVELHVSTKVPCQAACEEEHPGLMR